MARAPKPINFAKAAKRASKAARAKPDLSFDFGANSHAVAGRADGGGDSPPVSAGEKKKKAAKKGRKRAKAGKASLWTPWGGKKRSSFRAAAFGSM